jgi:hypothetical protein
MSTVAQSFVLTGRTEFFFPYPVRFDTHVVLSIEGAGTVDPADYTVIGAGPSAVSCTVRYPNAPADGQLLTIARVIPAQRDQRVRGRRGDHGGQAQRRVRQHLPDSRGAVMPFPAPSNLAAQVLSTSSVLLTWDEVDGATAHQVKKNGIVQATANASWVDNAFDPDAVTVYEVRAFIIEFDVGPTPITLFGAPATITLGDEDGDTDVPPPPDALAAPFGLTAEQTDADEVTVEWELLTPATHIDVEINSGTPVRIPAATTYLDEDLSAGDERSYRVRAVNTEADPEVVSDWAGPVAVTVAALGVPEPNVTVLSSTRLLIDWAAVPGATDYDIEIDGEVLAVGTFNGYQDVGLSPEQTRTYRVRANATSVVGDWSAAVTGQTNRSVPLVTTGVPGRRSYFPADRHITARALAAEFDNIYALTAGGEVETPPTGDPAPEDPTAIPIIFGLTAAWVGSSIVISWDAPTWPTRIPVANRGIEVVVSETDTGGAPIWRTRETGTSVTVTGASAVNVHSVRVRAIDGTLGSPTETGDYAMTDVPALGEVTTDPVLVSSTAQTLTSSGTIHQFDVPAAAETGDRVLVVAAVFPAAGATIPDAWVNSVVGWNFAPAFVGNSQRPKPSLVSSRFPAMFLLIDRVMPAVVPSTGTLSLPFTAQVAFHAHLYTADVAAPRLGTTWAFTSSERPESGTLDILTPPVSGERKGVRALGFLLEDGASLTDPPVTPTVSTVTVRGTDYQVASAVSVEQLPVTFGNVRYTFSPVLGEFGSAIPYIPRIAGFTA